MSKEIKGKKYGRLYLESYRKAVVLEVEREGGAIALVSERHGLRSKLVQIWTGKYGSAEYLASRGKRRSPAEINKIIREIVSGRSTISEVQLKYQIDCRDTVTGWIRKYKKAEQDVSQDAKTTAVPEKDHQLREMQKELEMARLKIRALEIVVDIASDQFNVDIRKKFGAKQ
jgi:transposase-like protein